MSDAPEITRLAGDRAIAATTLNIPQPYEQSMAEKFIEMQATAFEKGEMANFVITLAADQSFIGVIGLAVSQQHSRAELGYWIGKPFWGNGYATEAGRAMLQYGFEELGLRRIHAGHFANNPASGRVQQKLGMVREGYQRKHILKWGEEIDHVLNAILKSEYERMR
jgi:RimJ/RimL family protein N-acetyltransferase